MRAAWLVAGVELRRRLRNRSAVFSAFVGPLVLAAVFGVLLGGTSSFTLRIGVVDLDHSDVTTGLVSGLVDQAPRAEQSPVRFSAISTRSAADAALDGDDVDAAIVLPEGFGAAVTTGRSATVTVLRDARKKVSAGIAASVARQLIVGVSARRLAVATSMMLGDRTPTEAELDEMTDAVLTAVASEEPGGNSVGAATFFGASMSILFLFFTVAFAARSVIAEQKAGLFPRMLASPTSPSSIVIGKVSAVSLLGLAGFVTVWAVTTFVFGSAWGSPLAVVVVMIATVLAIGGVATFVCGLAGTAEQADGYTSMVAFALALLGGNFLGPGQAPKALQRTASFTPNGQALDAFTRLAADGATLPEVSRQLLMLLAFSVCFGVVGQVLIGRRLRR